MQAYRFLEPAVPEILHMDLFFSTFTAHSHIFTFILDLAFKTYYAVPSFQGMALEFTNKLRYLDCQSKETSTSRYPFPLAKKNRHDERKAYQDEAVQGYYPDIDEGIVLSDSFVNRSASLGIRHQKSKKNLRGGPKRVSDLFP
ncbi:hypothetical protein ACJX0J_001106 (mitochondrion) [Zea mays]